MKKKYYTLVLCFFVLIILGGCSQSKKEEIAPSVKEKIEVNAIDVYGYRSDRDFKYKDVSYGENYNFQFISYGKNEMQDRYIEFTQINYEDKLGFHITFKDKTLSMQDMYRKIPAQVYDMNHEPYTELLKDGYWELVPLRDTYILPLDKLILQLWKKRSLFLKL